MRGMLFFGLCLGFLAACAAEDRPAGPQGGDEGRLRPKERTISDILGKPDPAPKPLVWEKDYAAAQARARAEKRLILILFRSDESRESLDLERRALADPWIRTFLADFVLVKSDGDAEMTKKHRVEAMPTLVFTTDVGPPVMNFGGNGANDPFGFASLLTMVYETGGRKLPPSLQKLADVRRAERKAEREAE